MEGQQKNLEELNQGLKAKLEEVPLQEAGEEPEKVLHRGHRHRKKKKRSVGNRIFRIFVGVLIGILALLLLCAAVLLVMRYRGERSLSTKAEDVKMTVPEKIEDDVVIENDGTVIYKGEKYRYNEDIINILCMGVDREREQQETVVGKNGQSDSIFLAALDKSTGNMTLLAVSRDSMVDVDVYNIDDEFVKTEKKQLCLAYAYGKDDRESSENVVRSAQRLLYGIPITGFAAINLPSIAVLNDAVDGVEVEILEDFSSWDSTMRKGNKVKLTGQQAKAYVQTRDVSKVDSNQYRVRRQKQYLLAFVNKALQQTKKDITVPLELYTLLGDDLTTNIDSSEVTYLASLLLQHGMPKITIESVPGEVRMGGKNAEFYPDDAALYELILKLFYTKVTQ